MTQVTVLAVGGTGESHPDDHRNVVTGLLSGVTDNLDSRFAARWVGYPASYGPVAIGGLSYRQSTDVGVRRLIAAIRAVAGPVAVIGYSQGCSVIREVLGKIEAGEVSLPSVVAAGLISDPQQPAEAVPGCTGRGVAGTGPALPSQVSVMWVGHPRDMICNASDDSLIRDIADLTRWMSFRTPKLWLRQLWALMRSNGFQNAAKTRLSPKQWVRDAGRLRIAAIELGGYLPRTLVWRHVRVSNPSGDRHIAYASEPLDDSGLTGCQIMAQWLQVQATFGPYELAA
ncbi:PE-PPE domain-containing protein [Rhodococcus sp. G-MC3]|uniref:PE-PPE domain-containing protein n=1 Tax=Rhodococcus sp. G-MC3 TaxID=3046209 RepID=UPI0024BA93C6|nr:PE-PPE domain-containing protein [Rhodococcus sp. G-MC3]MDJ0392289.1 PE-PPE domain-containing protein [Rhodococcus sp. G-MC3]